MLEGIYCAAETAGVGRGEDALLAGSTDRGNVARLLAASSVGKYKAPF
jgi:hypothetical protein